MATTGRMMGLLAAEERRKRSRTERDEDEEPRPIPELPPEVQLAIVKRAELGRSGAVPEPSDRLVEVSKIWHGVYTAWQSGRAVKMEHRPDQISLDLARLFISPRFKLIGGMQWPAVREILRAYDRSATRPQFPILVFYRVAPVMPGFTWMWHAGFLQNMTRGDDDRIVYNFLSKEVRLTGRAFFLRRAKIVFAPVESTAVDEDEDAFERFTTTIIEAWEDEDATDSAVTGIRVTDALIYGRTYMFPSGVGSRMRGDVIRRLQMAGNLFMYDAERFDRPTQGMLAWRDKIVVIEAVARPAHYRAKDADHLRTINEPGNVQVEVLFYHERDSEYPMKVITLDMVADGILVKHLNRDARDKANAIFGEQEEESVSSLDRIMVEVVWSNGARVSISDWKKGDDEIYALPEDEDALVALERRVAELPEPALKSFVKYPDKWGYETSVFTPPISDDRGMLIMPAPWFFYFTMEGPESAIGGHLALSDVGFWFDPETVMLLTVDSSHIYAHQPFELIFLPDTLDDREVEGLTMLQKKSLKHRATAPLVRDEIELL